MRKVVKLVLLLPIRIGLIPVELALILITWIGIFATSVSAWIFNMVVFILFMLARSAASPKACLRVSPGSVWGTSFVSFIIPFVAEWLTMRIVDLRCFIW